MRKPLIDSCNSYPKISAHVQCCLTNNYTLHLPWPPSLHTKNLQSDNCLSVSVSPCASKARDLLIWHCSLNTIFTLLSKMGGKINKTILDVIEKLKLSRKYEKNKGFLYLFVYLGPVCPIPLHPLKWGCVITLFNIRVKNIALLCTYLNDTKCLSTFEIYLLVWRLQSSEYSRSQ